MGTEAVWVPALISALGAGAGVVANQQARRKQEDIATEQMRGQQTHQHQADAMLNSELDRLKGSNADASRKASLEGFLSQLKANQANAGGASTPGGARYQADTTAAGADIKNYGTGRADTMSRIAAPGLQRVAEGQSINRTLGDVAGESRNASGDAFLQALRANSVQANPWLIAGGQVAQGAGSAMASSGWGAQDPALEVPAITAQRQSYIPPYLRRNAFG